MHNDVFWNSFEIMEALNLRSVDNSFYATNISIDTRTIKPGEIYLAIQGKNFDGHNFINEAFEKGASGVIINRSWKNNVLSNQTYFIVDDTFEALQNLAKHARKKTKAKIIGVTGSIGKTTVKEWLSLVLAHFGPTVSSQKSFNNHWGVPLSLTNLKNDTQFGIFEIGMNHPNEIGSLSQMVNPHIACITKIAEAHIGNMNSLEAIAHEKSQIFSGLTEDGQAIINFETSFKELLYKQAQYHKASSIISVGYSSELPVQINHYETNIQKLQTHVTGRVFDESIAFTLPFIGEHHVQNSIFVLAICKALGLSIRKACTVLPKLPLIEGRGSLEVIKTPSGKITLIDDSYNANPTSMQAGLSILKQFKKGRRVAILGDMKELGKNSTKMHTNLHAYVTQDNADLVLTVGSKMKKLHNFISSNQNTEHFCTYEHLNSRILKILKQDDIVFIKGSNSMNLSKVVEYLKNSSRTKKQMNLAVA